MAKILPDAEMQLHQGSKLKKIIEKSDFLIKDISENTEVAVSSLYDMFAKQEILPSKIRPILKLLGVTFYEFYGFYEQNNLLKDDPAPYGYKEQCEALQRENDLLKTKLADKDEIIALLKSKK